MGALHEGHLSLIDLARGLIDAGRVSAADANRARRGRVVVSIFVNPTQFNDPSDLDRYPRTLDRDAEFCAARGVDVLWAPGVEEMYPDGVDAVTPPLPEQAMGRGLEDAHRPGHFAGVSRVVDLLLGAVSPRWAVFGEKDWQQLVVVRSMAAAAHAGVEIVGGETVREPDGLAMSSRNRFLSPEARHRAVGLWRALDRCRHEPDHVSAERVLLASLQDAALTVEYAAIRDADTLLEPRSDRPARALAAVRLNSADGGSVRLLDNVAWPG